MDVEPDGIGAGRLAAGSPRKAGGTAEVLHDSPATARGVQPESVLRRGATVSARREDDWCPDGLWRRRISRKRDRTACSSGGERAVRA